MEGGDCFVPDPESNSGLVSRNDTFVDSRLCLCPNASIRYSSRMTGREIASQEPVLSRSARNDKFYKFEHFYSV